MPPRRGRRSRRHDSDNDDDDTTSSVAADDSRARAARSPAAAQAAAAGPAQPESIAELLEHLKRQEDRIKALEAEALQQAPHIVSTLAGRLSLEDTVLVFDLLSLQSMLANGDVEEVAERIDDMLEDIEIRSTMSLTLWAENVNDRILGTLSEREATLQQDFIDDRYEAWKGDPVKKSWVALAAHPWRPRSTAEFAEAPLSRRSRRQGKKDTK
jgi:hypothetical protein